jgi:two-component system, LuxR family, response regulator FixJ
MTESTRHDIFFVDDEPSVCKAVQIALAHADYRVSTFTDPLECLATVEKNRCDLVICDVKMPTMSGLSLLVRIKSARPALPVVLVTGYGDVPMAVKALKAGAAHFIEKPLDTPTLLAVVESVLSTSSPLNLMQDRPLTKAEKRVLDLVVQGKSNREIADLLHRSIRTVEDHRTNIMHKLHVSNIVDLIRLVVSLDLDRGS